MASSKRLTLLFILLAIVVCALVNPGNFGTIDTTHRWQVERSLRLGESPVSAEDTRRGFYIHGRNGSPQAGYGIGQSLLLLPFDAVVDATVTPAARRFGLDPVRQRQVAEIALAFLMQSFLTACVLCLARSVLLSFGFGEAAAVAGALALLFATTCLQYVQCAQENELLLALALSALAALRAWHTDPRGIWPLLAGMACGFALLVRLPSLLETGTFALFALATSGRPKRLLAWFAPPVMVALAADRWYQWRRFGEWFSTYIGVFGRQQRPPFETASFPFSHPFWQGFWRTFFAPGKSVFLFDPLLILAILLAARHWRAIDRELRFLVAGLGLLLVAYVAAYARYYNFGGDVAWGHRFVLLPVELLCLFVLPLLMRHRWRALWVVVFASVILQVASTVTAPNTEIIQVAQGHGHGILWNRAVNLAQLATGREDPKRFEGIPAEWHSIAYFPFQLRLRFPQLARWAIGAWTVLLLTLFVVLAAIWRQVRA